VTVRLRNLGSTSRASSDDHDDLVLLVSELA
jgi:hypothetical protein